MGPGFRMVFFVASLAFWVGPGDLPVTPRFGGFVLCCRVLFCVGWFAFDFVFFAFCFGSYFVTAYWTVHRSFTSSLLRPLNQQMAMCMQ